MATTLIVGKREPQSLKKWFGKDILPLIESVTKIFAKGSEIHKLQSFLSPAINVELQVQFNQRLHNWNIDCGERGPQVLEKVIWQRYFVTNCR